MRNAFIALACLAACATPTHAQTRAPFSVEAIVADAAGYVGARYQQSELPSALIADLEAAEFQCQHSAAGSECTRSRQASSPCFDVIRVDISAGSVSADQNRLCMGAEE
jgi:hypothetical protein